ncbi:glycoside hydrolase family protein [Flavipsychrobacter stenotrophus]|uniref:glycoside hydrolase family protein n=1 Tax=Flavipsychrobacter stenotrophus TaxID=2077091 RepID=UPI003744138A
MGIYKLSKQGYELIKKLEGIKNKAYQDSVGIWTVGIGFIQVSGVKVTAQTYLTDEQIEAEFFN